MLGGPSEAFEADVVLTMLSDDAAIRSVILDADLLAAACPRFEPAAAGGLSVKPKQA